MTHLIQGVSTVKQASGATVANLAVRRFILSIGGLYKRSNEMKTGRLFNGFRRGFSNGEGSHRPVREAVGKGGTRAGGSESTVDLERDSE